MHVYYRYMHTTHKKVCVRMLKLKPSIYFLPYIMDSDAYPQGITHIRGCYLFRGGFIQGTVYACVCRLCVYVCVYARV